MVSQAHQLDFNMEVLSFSYSHLSKARTYTIKATREATKSHVY